MRPDRRREVVEIGDRRAAIEHAVAWARPGDVVLIAGKGHEAGQTSARADAAVRRPRRTGRRAEARGARVIDLTVAQIAEIVGGELRRHRRRRRRPTRVTGTVEFDSRAVTPGGLFLALPGARADGHDFAAAAVAAARSRCWRPVRSGCPAIVVDPTLAGSIGSASVLEHDTDGSGAAVLAALAKLAAGVAAELVEGGLTIVGVTGSSGKTSTKDLLAAVLAPLGEVIAPPGSFNNELGHPWTVLRATATPTTWCWRCRRAIRATSPRWRPSRRRRSRWCSTSAPPTSASSVRGRPSPRPKPNCRRRFRPSGVVVLNVDDRAVAAMADKTAARVVRVGRSSRRRRRAGRQRRRSTTAGAGRLHAAMPTAPQCRRHSWRCTATTRCPTRCARPPSRWNAAHRRAGRRGAGRGRTGLAQRMEVVTRDDGVTIINDAYNANPDSMRAGLKALAWMGRRAGSRAEAGRCWARWPSSATTRYPSMIASAGSRCD